MKKKKKKETEKLKFNLKDRCIDCGKKEFYYGAKLNKDIKDVYLGMGFLESSEKNRKIGPGRRHEEILLLLNGEISVISKKEEITLKEGDVYFMPDGQKIRLNNLTDQKCYFVVAGGHTKHHRH
jgi:ethanolamine utilization protein EutQ (cupin superfamily)